MWGWDLYRRGWLGAVLAAALVSGCTWTRPWTTTPTVTNVGPVTTLPPVPPTGPALPPAAPIDGPAAQAADLSVKLTASEEEKANLLARVTNLEAALEERDRAFRQASAEVQSACEEMSRARLELQHWKQEAASLHQRVESAEKENMATLQTIVMLLEKLTERTNALSPPPTLPAPSPVPPLPAPSPVPAPTPADSALPPPRPVNPEALPMPREQPEKGVDNLPTGPAPPGQE